MASNALIGGVCHLLLCYYPQIGGAETQARRLASYQREHGWRVCVVASRHLADPVERTWPAHQEIDGIPVYRVPTRGRGHLAAASYFLSALWQLGRLRRQYQVIHAHMLPAPAMVGGLGGRLLGKKVVAKVSSGGTGVPHVRDNLSGLRGSLAARVRMLWLRTTVDRYVAISSSIADELYQVGFRHDRIVQIPNGVDVHEFAPTDEDQSVVQSRLGLPAGPLLTYTGRLRPRKNLGTLIEAVSLLAQEHPSLHLALVGAGIRRDMEEQHRLEQLAQQLGLEDRVLLIGHAQNTLPYLQASTLFVIPSFREGLSNAMLEAMAAGLPVVSTRVSGAEDLIQSGVNGVLLSSSPTPEEIARAVSCLLDDPQRAREMGQRARQTVVERCAFEVVGERVLSLYGELVGVIPNEAGVIPSEASVIPSEASVIPSEARNL